MPSPRPGTIALGLLFPLKGGVRRVGPAADCHVCARPLAVGARLLAAGYRPLAVGARPLAVDARPLAVEARLLAVDARALGAGPRPSWVDEREPGEVAPRPIPRACGLPTCRGWLPYSSLRTTVVGPRGVGLGARRECRFSGAQDHLRWAWLCILLVFKQVTQAAWTPLAFVVRFWLVFLTVLWLSSLLVRGLSRWLVA